MNVYIDEDVNPRIARFIVGHQFSTPNSTGYKGLKNGELLAALEGSFQVWITHDKNLAHEQNLSKTSLCVVVLEMDGRLLTDYEAIAPATQAAISNAVPGTWIMVQLKPAS